MFTHLIKTLAVGFFVLALGLSSLSSRGWAGDPELETELCVTFDQFLSEHPKDDGGMMVWSGWMLDGTYATLYHFDKKKRWVMFTFHKDRRKVCFELRGTDSKPHLSGLVI